MTPCALLQTNWPSQDAVIERGGFWFVKWFSGTYVEIGLIGSVNKFWCLWLLHIDEWLCWCRMICICGLRVCWSYLCMQSAFCLLPPRTLLSVQVACQVVEFHCGQSRPPNLWRLIRLSSSCFPGLCTVSGGPVQCRQLCGRTCCANDI